MSVEAQNMESNILHPMSLDSVQMNDIGNEPIQIIDIRNSLSAEPPYVCIKNLFNT